MKTFKLISLLLLSFCLGGCDDETVTGDDVIGGDGTANIDVAFADEAMSVLRNATLLQIPIRLEALVENDVKITFATLESDKSNSAREGIDFNLPERVLTIPAGDTIGYILVELIDNGAINDDKIAVLNITGVYGGQLGEKSVCSLHIISNAFVEFDKNTWKTYESATVENEYKKTLSIPLKVIGTITEAASFEVTVTDSTAKDSEHFEIISKSITVNPGDDMVYLELQPKDDNLANYNRLFNLSITAITNGNLAISKTNSTCEVVIVSEEKIKTLSLNMQTLNIDEGGKQELLVLMDNPVVRGEADVTVNLVQKTGGNVLDGEYTLSKKSLTFSEGEKSKYIILTTYDAPSLFVDRKFTLELNSPSEGGVLSEEQSHVDVLIHNTDELILKETYSFDENSGDVTIPLTIPSATTEDLEVAVEAISISNAEAKVHYRLMTPTVTIGKGETTANIKLNIGYKEEWTDTPKFKVTAKISGSAKTAKLESEISLVKSVYRCGELFVDSRDGKSYKTVKIGNQCWMAENLNVGTYSESPADQLLIDAWKFDTPDIQKWCYDNSEANCTKYGGLYEWWETVCGGDCDGKMTIADATTTGITGRTPMDLKSYGAKLTADNKYVQGICPEGWHLPTMAEWELLGTHQKGWNALDGGWLYWLGGRVFQDSGATAWWWASDSDYSSKIHASTYTLTDMSLGSEYEWDYDHLSNGVSVRCIKN